MTLNTRWGDVVYPLESSGQLWAVGDPSRDRLAELFRTVINTELATAWNAARTGTALETASPVENVLYREPDRSALRARGTKFPMLAVYRNGRAEHEWFTLSYRHVRSTWRVDYLLGPLNELDHRRLGGALNAVVRSVDSVLVNNRYSGFKSGTRQFELGSGGFSSIEVVGSTEGIATISEDGEGLELFMVAIEIETVEREDPYSGGSYTSLDGIDFSQEIADND